MKVMFACLCDYAVADQQGKLNLNGIFDRIGVRQFPALHGKMFLAVRLLFEYADNDKTNNFAITFKDQDEKVLFGLQGGIGGQSIDPGSFRTFNQIFELSNVILPQPGKYTITLVVPGQPSFEFPLEVVQV